MLLVEKTRAITDVTSFTDHLYYIKLNLAHLITCMKSNPQALMVVDNKL